MAGMALGDSAKALSSVWKRGGRSGVGGARGILRHKENNECDGGRGGSGWPYRL